MAVMYDRPAHQRLARLLADIDGEWLYRHRCLLSGGTAATVRFGEYRNTENLCFLTSSREGYQALRGLVRSRGAGGLFWSPIQELLRTRVDQFGVRSTIAFEGEPLRLKLSFTSRLLLDDPGTDDQICGVACLTVTDMAAEQLLTISRRRPVTMRATRHWSTWPCRQRRGSGVRAGKGLV